MPNESNASTEATTNDTTEAKATNSTVETGKTVDSNKGDSNESQSGDTDAAKAAAKRLFKVKIDNEEAEVDEDELIRGYQLRKASDKRFQEASSKAKEIEQILSILKTDPKKALTHPEIGVDIRKFAEQVLAEQLEEELMDPKEKELRTLKRQYEEAQAKLKETEEAGRKAKEEETIKGYQEQYSKDIESAVKGSGLPYNAGVVNRVRDYMLAALNNGYELSAKDVMPYVKEDFVKDIQSLFSTSEAQVLAELIGEEGLKKVKSWDLSRLKNPKGKVPEKQATQKESAADLRSKSKSTEEYFAELRKKFG